MDDNISCQGFTSHFRSLGNMKICGRLGFNEMLALLLQVGAESGLCIQHFYLYSNNLCTD